jgi:hypothetical protein
MKYKMIILLVVGYIISVNSCSGANNKTDYYIDDTGKFAIKIKNDTVTFFSQFDTWFHPYPHFFKAAVCTFKHIDGDFVELNTIDEFQPQFFRDKIQYQWSDTLTGSTDSIYIDLTSEYYSLSPELFPPYVVKCEYFNGITNRGKCSWSIRRKDESSTRISIMEKKDVIYGSNEYSQYFYDYDFLFSVDLKNHNHLKIIFPFQISQLFGSYIILNEYAKMSSKGFQWRQYRFKKFKPSKNLKKQFQ